MKKTKKETFRLGLFVVLGMIVFIAAIYFIGEQKNMFDKTFTISANFNNVNGLMQGNNVRYSGINVGTVKNINMINDSTINVELIINEKMVQHIKKDAIATIGSDGLVGNMIVNIIPGEGSAAHINQGDVIKTYTKIGTGEMLNTLNTTNENAALLTSKLLDIVNSINKGKGTLGMLIKDTLMANNVSLTLENLKLTSQEANRTMLHLNSLISEIDLDESVAGVLLNDTTEANKVRSIITNLETSSVEIQSVITNLNETITNIKDGEGTINYLSNDPDLVKQLDESIKNINEGTEKFNENMEALKHNFLTRGYFKKLEKEERKAAKDNN
ncbi:MlaD family protein [Xanthomarina sp. F2636L]|uniref:MlaD family protein n=1 Tax=Xanthomarina sp. F2636L TaxID=2996018 RepID=UPI00225E6B05|nr:MlaD family protein [Xanthomarina sp. F2636L]MCX7551725.1 MlaD family protein [Xanthomarina sp. F2636L]